MSCTVWTQLELVECGINYEYDAVICEECKLPISTLFARKDYNENYYHVACAEKCFPLLYNADQFKVEIYY